MKSRESFVLQVKDTIVKEHGREESTSFIFGLSGKWGEGKTKFLEELATRLQDAGFEKPIVVSPWKYGGDQISFLRNFLKDVAKFSKKSWLHKLRDFINNRDDFRELYSDTTKSQVHWGWVLIIWLLAIDAIVIYVFDLPLLHIFAPQIITEVQKYYYFIAGIVITPFFVPLIHSFLTTQQTNKSISTIDQFDTLLEEFLANINSKKLVVFIDDLDRVTPEIARNVLDNMRIFFDKSEITFVVTGDHSVLERYIGTLTLPGSTIAQQIEEGRRYLKKIFNLYWRLPLPLDSEFAAFVQDLFTEHESEIQQFFPKTNDKEKFALYLEKYFDKNFRQTIRFFDTVLFTFDIIKNQHDNADAATKKYYSQMLENPLLVVRILMIQELCMPLYDAITSATGELRNLEYMVEKKYSEEIEKKLQEYGTFTPTQLVFIRKFLYEEPRFFKNRRLTVYAFEPFLYLSADANLGDARGLNKEDFVKLLQTGDPAQIANDLQNSGDEMSKKAAEATVEFLGRTTAPPVQPADKSAEIKTIVAALTSIPDHFSQTYFIKDMRSLDYSQIFSGTQNPVRLQISQDFWKWLDTQAPDKVDQYSDLFPFVNQGDFENIELTNPPLGHFSSKILSRWLKEYYASNKELALLGMEKILPALDSKSIDSEFSANVDQFSADIITWGTPEQREKLYQIIIGNVASAKESLRKIVFEKIKNNDEVVWQWASQKENDNFHLWSSDELEIQIIQSLENIGDSNQLLSKVTFAGAKIVKNNTIFWEEVAKKYALFVTETANQLSNLSFPTFSPSEKIARIFYENILQHIESSDDAQKVALIPSLQKKWLFAKIQNMPGYQRIKKIGNTQNSDIIREVNIVLQTWAKPLLEENTTSG